MNITLAQEPVMALDSLPWGLRKMATERKEPTLERATQRGSNTKTSNKAPIRLIVFLIP